MNLTVPAVIQAAIDRGAAVAISVSAGKDSQAMERALQYGVCSSDIVRNIVLQLAQPAPVASPLDLSAQPALSDVSLPVPDLGHFDRLLTTRQGD